MKTTAFCVFLLLWIAMSPASAVATAPAMKSEATPYGLRRCIGADGVPIFTDRRCEDLQAVESARQAETLRAGVAVRVRSCARNQDDLLFGVRSALESRDVNRLADFYHWAGLATAQGYRIMERLSAFSERPLVDVQLVSSRHEPDYEPGFAPEQDDLGMAADAITPLGLDPTEAAHAPPRPHRLPDLLRVDQMRGVDAITTQVTYFHLRSNAGCWWLQF